MTFSDDILARAKTDFGGRADQAMEILLDAIAKNDKLKSDRIIRCIIYLAKGDIQDLTKYIESAVIDTRDVIFWAEYSGINEYKTPKQLRDFNKTFDKSSIDFKK